MSPLARFFIDCLPVFLLSTRPPFCVFRSSSFFLRRAFFLLFKFQPARLLALATYSLTAGSAVSDPFFRVGISRASIKALLSPLRAPPCRLVTVKSCFLAFKVFSLFPSIQTLYLIVLIIYPYPPALVIPSFPFFFFVRGPFGYPIFPSHAPFLLTNHSFFLLRHYPFLAFAASGRRFCHRPHHLFCPFSFWWDSPLTTRFVFFLSSRLS